MLRHISIESTKSALFNIRGVAKAFLSGRLPRLAHPEEKNEEEKLKRNWRKSGKIQKYTTQQKFPNSSFKDTNLNIRGKVKVVKR